MQNASSIVLSRMVAASQAMDVVANNIANASTPGYKSVHLSSTAWIDRMENTDAPDGGQTVAYNLPRGTWRDEAAGPIQETGNPLDLALSGSGFFTVQTAEGVRLTRDGRFSMSADGTLVTTSGDAVLDSAGQPISISGGKVSTSSDGTITGTSGVIGNIAVVNVSNGKSLTAEGSNLFSAQGGWTPVSAPKIVQGALEDSNVKPIIEITDMLKASQNFQMISQFLSAEQTRHENAISKIISAT